MSKIAIDIALLPKGEVKALAIKMSEFLYANNSVKKLELGDLSLPHISLALCVVEEEKLPLVLEKVKKIASETSSLHLIGSEFKKSDYPNASGIKIEKTSALLDLFQNIRNELLPLLSFDAKTEMFYDPEWVDEVTTSWVVGYEKKFYDISLFSPHISIGHGYTDIFSDGFPLEFDVSSIAVCHLGNFCMCKKVFAEFDLS